MDKNGDITDFWYEMSRIPVEPKLAKTLLFAEKYDCQIEAIAIAATQSVPNIFFKPKDENEQSIALQRRHSFKLKEWSVITSYSIHYTKLYDFIYMNTEPVIVNWVWDYTINYYSKDLFGNRNNFV